MGDKIKYANPHDNLLIEYKCPCCETIHHETFNSQRGYAFRSVHRDLVFLHGETRIWNVTEKYLEDNFDIVEREQS